MSTTKPTIAISDRTNRIRRMPQFGRDVAEALEMLSHSVDRSGQIATDAAATAAVAVAGPTITATNRGALSVLTHDFTDPNSQTTKVRVRVQYTKPSPNDAKGVQFWFERPYKPIGDEIVVGSFVAGDLSKGAHGPWATEDQGRKAFNDSDTYDFTFDQPLSPEEAWLVYADTWSDTYTPELVRKGLAGETPNALFTVQRWTNSSGTEYCPNVQKPTLVLQEDINQGGRIYKVLNFGLTWPDDLATKEVLVELFDVTASLLEHWTFKRSQVTESGGAKIVWDLPSQPTEWTVRFRAGDGANFNTYVFGITPEITVSTATIGGLDLSQALASSIAAHLTTASGVLGIAASSLTRSMLQNFIIGINQLENAAIIKNAHILRAGIDKLVVLDADIDTITASKVTTGTLAAGVVYAGVVNVNQLTAGTATFASTVKFEAGSGGPFVQIESSGITLQWDATHYITITTSAVTLNQAVVSLDLNNVVTTLNNTVAASFPYAACLKGVYSPNGYKVYVTPLAVWMADNLDNALIWMDTVSGSGEVSVRSGGLGSTVSISAGVGGFTGLVVNGNRVVGPKVTLPSSDVAGIITVLQTHGLC